MGKVFTRLTVFFDEPFWVGVFEKMQEGSLSVSKVIFGAEPKDGEVLDFILKHYNSLNFSPAVSFAVKEAKKNPKVMQRKVKKELQKEGIGTKSQQALKLWQEQYKQDKKTNNRAQKNEREERLFLLKQQKKKAKHKGH